MHLNKISNDSNNESNLKRFFRINVQKFNNRTFKKSVHHSDSATKLPPIRNYRSIDMILIDFKPNNNPKNLLQSVPPYFDQGNRMN